MVMIIRMTYFAFIFLFVSANDTKMINEYIRKWVEDIESGNKFEISGERLYCVRFIPEYYNQHAFEPAWTSERNKREFVHLLSQVDEEGLLTDDYHYQKILALSENAQGVEEHAEFKRKS